MNYTLAKQLKDAGFPTVFSPICKEKHGHGNSVDSPCLYGAYPTLEELIEVCGDGFSFLDRRADNSWVAVFGSNDSRSRGFHIRVEASTPTEAVARLWLALNKK